VLVRWGDCPPFTPAWRGRAPEDCRFERRDIVGLDWGGEFRWAIVLSVPYTPAQVAVLHHEVSPDCDSYNVYFADGGHTHPAESQLLRAPRPVPRATLKGLMAMWARRDEKWAAMVRRKRRLEQREGIAS